MILFYYATIYNIFYYIRQLKNNYNSNELKEILNHNISSVKSSEPNSISNYTSSVKSGIKTFTRSYSSNLESKEKERIKPALATFVSLI
jgi:hypothetical protein